MATDANGGTLGYRVGELEKDVERLYRQKARVEDVAALKHDVGAKATVRDLDGLRREVQDLGRKVQANTRALVAFALTIAGSAVGIAFAVLTGGH
jgi:hypothetical protein